MPGYLMPGYLMPGYLMPGYLMPGYLMPAMGNGRGAMVALATASLPRF